LLRASDRPPVTAQNFPSAEQAAEWYVTAQGGRLTDPHPFAASPFASRQQQEECDRAFAAVVPDLDRLIDAAVNRDYVPFQEALMLLIDKTVQSVSLAPH